MKAFKILLLVCCLVLTLGAGICGGCGVVGGSGDSDGNKNNYNGVVRQVSYAALGVAVLSGLSAWALIYSLRGSAKRQ